LPAERFKDDDEMAGGWFSSDASAGRAWPADGSTSAPLRETTTFHNI
jgi:hypothetical protein